MKRILIIGSGGAGKSTLSRKLGKILNLPVIHLDAHHWRAGWVAPPTDIWRDQVSELVKGECWVMDGNYRGSLDIRMPAADTIIFMDFPRLICMWRVFKRVLRWWGRTRPDLSAGCLEQLPDREFLGWIWNFQRDNRPGIINLLSNFSAEKTVITLRSPGEAARFLKRL